MLNKHFSDEMNRYYTDGIEPLSIDRDFRYSLRQHQKRLQSKGIVIRRWFQTEESEFSHDMLCSSGDFDVSLHMAHMRYITDIFYGDRMLMHLDERRILHAFQLDKKADSNEKKNLNSQFSCPNCGNVAPYASFINGCPYCGTRFMMDQIYPCVTNYFTIPEIIDNKGVKNSLAKVGKGIGIAIGCSAAVAFLIAFLVVLFAGNQVWEAVAGGIIALLFGVAVSGFISLIVYLSFSAFVGAKFAAGASKALSEGIDLQVSARNKEEMTNAIVPCDPAFSYEYLESKVASYIRAIAFSDKRDKLTIYKGNNDRLVLNDVIDIEYRGALKYMSHSFDNGIISINVRAYVYTTRFIDGAIMGNKEQYRLHMSRKAVPGSGLDFSIHAVNCDSCGASFDAEYENVCPSCGHKYDLQNDDWVVTGMVSDNEV